MFRRSTRQLAITTRTGPFARSPLVLDISQKTGHRYIDGSGRDLDGPNLPTFDLYQPLISDKKYPARAGAWAPVVQEGVPSPYKGKIVVAGAGVVGCTLGTMFALRGFHVTVLDRRPKFDREDKLASLETALVTKRAADQLGVAGIKTDTLRHMGGRKVVGLVQHSSSTLGTWLSQGLNEFEQFPVNMVTIDMHLLRCTFADQMSQLPTQNARVFFDHALAAVFPDKKICVLKPLREHERDRSGAGGNHLNFSEYTEIKEHNELVETWGDNPNRPSNLSTHVERWEDNVEGIEYDLLIGADGANSKLRQMLALGTTHYTEWGVRWFQVKNSTLRNDTIHQWVHRFDRFLETEITNSKTGRKEKRTRPNNLATITAYPVAEDHCFNVMVYFPTPILEEIPSFDQLRDKYAEDLTGDLHLAQPHIIPHPTVFCDQLYNDKYYPNCVLLGDAAHACHPYLNQNLAIALEDAGILLNMVDSVQYNKDMLLSLQAFSAERGSAGDALRIISEKAMYYYERKQYDPLIRMANSIPRWGKYVVPQSVNQMTYSASNNFVLPRTMAEMLNGKGYCSYKLAEEQQYRASDPSRFMYFWPMRLYT